MSKTLTRDDFLGSVPTLKAEPVEVPELGGTVYLRELSVRQKLDYKVRIDRLRTINPEIGPANGLELMALAISYSACDAEGNPLFTEADVRRLADSDMAVVVSLSTKVMQMSGADPNALEEVTKQLKKVQTSASLDS